MTDIITLTFTLAVVWAAYVLGYSRGHEAGLKIPYQEISKCARQWINDSDELLRRKWSDTQ